MEIARNATPPPPPEAAHSVYTALLYKVAFFVLEVSNILFLQ